jgi:hypothetical protein
MGWEVNACRFKHQKDMLKYEKSRCGWLCRYCHMTAHDVMRIDIPSYDGICSHMTVHPFLSLQGVRIIPDDEFCHGWKKYIWNPDNLTYTVIYPHILGI